MAVEEIQSISACFCDAIECGRGVAVVIYANKELRVHGMAGNPGGRGYRGAIEHLFRAEAQAEYDNFNSFDSFNLPSFESF